MLIPISKPFIGPLETKFVKEVLDKKWISSNGKYIKKLKLNKVIENKDIEKKLTADGKNLSGGEKQRIGIARALITKKPILILDEATNSLDKKTQYEILEIVKSLKKEKTIIVISHDKDVIGICDEVFYLKN